MDAVNAEHTPALTHLRQDGSAQMVDVSSGVEDRPGEKNASKIKAFLDAIRQI